MKVTSRLYILCVFFMLAGCGGSDQTTTQVTVTAAVSAGSGLTAFTKHDRTAYWTNFGDAGVVLSGANSKASSGSTISTYKWEQISGPAVTITSDTASQSMTFTAPVVTSILNASDQYRWQTLPVSVDDTMAKFRLTITDAAGHSDITTFNVYLFDNGQEMNPGTGLVNIGVGEKVYLSGPSWKATTAASTAVTDWLWTLTAPAGSSSTLSGMTSQIINMTPDVVGTYTVTYTSVSAATSGTITITATDYVGVGTIAGATPDNSKGQCGACHNGSVEPDTLGEWQGTGHSAMFQKVIGSYKSRAPRPYCWECHTTGYDTDATVANGGFSDLVAEDNYSFPSAGTTWNQFTSDHPDLAGLANIQCESCHGPGSEHKGDASKIALSKWNAGICGRCHTQETEWKVAAHNSTGVKHNSGRYRLTSWPGAACARCHTSSGFIQDVSGEEITQQTSDDVGVSCQACHDPHSTAADSMSGLPSVFGNNSTQLRLKGVVTMKDDAGTQIDAGKAAVCYTCHDGYYVKGEVQCDSDGDGKADVACETIDQVATQYFRQIHNNPQSFVLEGLGAVTHFSNSNYDFTLTENSFHSSEYFTLASGSGDSSKSSENNKCVTCHMGTAPTAKETGYQALGGHTWTMSGNGNEFTAACTPCHTSLTDLNRQARADYDGNGSVNGIQDEISGLLLVLTNKIKSIDSTNITGGTTQAEDGTITVAKLSYSSQAKMNSSPIDVRRAVYNHNLAASDGSKGVHNTAFELQLLQKTYSAISGLNGGASFESDYPRAVTR